MVKPSIVPRLIEPRLLAALGDTPVVLIHGPRQCGKTTLAKTFVGQGYAYFTFDDDIALTAAESDPLGFVDDLPDKVILDEIQRVPGLFRALKTAVDRNRKPGRFIFTGSANVLLVPQLSNALVGRMELIRLHPLAQAEMEQGSTKRQAFIDTLFNGSFKLASSKRLGKDLAKRIVKGGYPAMLTRGTPRRRAEWYRNYITTMIQRDVHDLSRIHSMDSLPRLLTLAAGQTARLLNVAMLAGPFQLSRPTIQDYLALLTGVFLMERLPPWHNNRMKRLVKAPKVHIGDTGLACALLGMEADSLLDDRQLLGQLLETFVFQELRRQAGWLDEPVSFSHFRDKDGVEVDIVMEGGGHSVAGVEVKASATVTAADFRGLKKLKSAAGKRFKGGAVVYDGETTVTFGDRLFAVPIRRLWE